MADRFRTGFTWIGDGISKVSWCNGGRVTRFYWRASRVLSGAGEAAAAGMG